MTIPPRGTPTRLRRTALVLTALWSAVAVAGGMRAAGAQAVRVPPVARVDAIFARYDSTTTPGCAVAVLHADSVVFRKAYGMAHIGFGVPMTTATTTWVPYSEARIFAALAVAMLARDGAISLDDPVRRHVPELPAYASAVTVRHLVHHTSGLADYGVLDPGFNLADRKSEDEVFRALARWGKLGFPPGRGQMYSNTDYALLKILVERVARRSLHDYLHQKLLGPLGMRATRIGADQGMVAPAHALFHEPVAGGWRTVLGYRISPVGGISVTTSVDDLARWARALRDSTSGVAELVTAIERGAPDSTRAAGFMFGVYRGERAGLPLVEYRGVGDYKYLVRAPGADLSVATVCNTYGDMWGFGPKVAALFAGRVDPAGAAAATATRTSAPTLAVPVAELRRYVGEFVTMEGRETGVRVTLPDSALVILLQGGRSFAMRPIGAGLFEFALPGEGLVHLTMSASDSTPGGLLAIARDPVTGEAEAPLRRKVTTRPPTATALRAYPGTYVGDAVDATLHVAVVDGRLMIAGRGLPPTELQPQQDADTFRFDIYIARFRRDAAGRVTHLALDASRVKGMRYTRRPAR